MQQFDHQISCHSFIYLGAEKLWSWSGSSIIQRYTPEFLILDGIADVGVTKNMNYVDDNDLHRGTMGILVVDPLICVAAMNLKKDVIIVEAASWRYADVPAKPKAFQIPNPSILVVKINTNRIIYKPTGAGPTGVKRRGSDVRAYERQVGNRITVVRAHPRNGGAPKPGIKIVKMD